MRRSAFVEMLCELVPASGSVIAKAIFLSPRPMPRSQVSFCSGVPWRTSTEPAIAGETTRSKSGQPAIASSSPTAASSVMPLPAAVELLRDVDAEEALLGQRVPQLARRLARFVAALEVVAAEGLGDAADGLAQHGLLLGGDEIEAGNGGGGGHSPEDMVRASMRAIQISEFGGPEVLQLVELPEPEPGDDEVVIEVTKAGLNFADTHQRHNQYIAEQELPMVPGSEVAGVRRDTGERVVALCGHGGYAEVATAPEEMTFAIPDGVGDEAALALLLQGLTAWHLYRTSAQLRRGESVVVHAAAGGVGSLAVQLAKPMGAGRVIASASTEEKRALAVELGADVAIDPNPDGLEERLVEANNGRKVDVILEMAGGESFEQGMAALARFGRMVLYGIATGERNSVRAGDLMKTSRAVVGFWLFHCIGRPEMVDEALADLFGRVKRGELRAVEGKTYPLADAAQAQVDLAERRTTGKVTLDLSATA